MNKILEDIENGKYAGPPMVKGTGKVSDKSRDYERKKEWYKIGEVMSRGHELKLYKSGKLSARRTYEYYSVDYGNWEGPSSRELSKKNETSYERLLAERKQGGLDITLDQVHEIINEHLQAWDPEQEIDGTISF